MEEKIIKCECCDKDKFRNELEECVFTVKGIEAGFLKLCKDCVTRLESTQLAPLDKIAQRDLARDAAWQEGAGWVK